MFSSLWSRVPTAFVLAAAAAGTWVCVSQPASATVYAGSQATTIVNTPLRVSTDRRAHPGGQRPVH